MQKSAAIWDSWVANATKPRLSRKRPLEDDDCQLTPPLNTDSGPFGPTIEVDEDGLSYALRAICRMPATSEDLELIYSGLQRSSIDASLNSPHKRPRMTGYRNPFASDTSFGGQPSIQYCCRRPMVVEIGLVCCCSCDECQFSHGSDVGPASADNFQI